MQENTAHLKMKGNSLGLVSCASRAENNGIDRDRSLIVHRGLLNISVPLHAVEAAIWCIQCMQTNHVIASKGMLAKNIGSIKRHLEQWSMIISSYEDLFNQINGAYDETR